MKELNSIVLKRIKLMKNIVFNIGVSEALRKLKPDAVVITELNYPGTWQCLISALSLGLPVLLRTEATPHITRHGQTLRNSIIKWVCNRCSAILSIGTLCTEFYRKIGIPQNKIFLTPYSVDNNYFFAQRDKWRPLRKQIFEELKLDSNLPTLLFSGKLIQRKRPLDALKIHGELWRSNIKTNMVFIGSGPLQSAIEAEAVKMGLSSVRITGFKNQQEIGKYYAVGDIFLFPSSEETWGLVVNEAMCFGMPVITTKGVGCVPDLVKHDYNGYIHECGDIIGMASTTARLIKDKEMLKQFGENSLRIISTWNFEADVSGFIKAFQYLASLQKRQKIL
jgi:glycosyltransferase involved in cell wall biosynthesis